MSVTITMEESPPLTFSICLSHICDAARAGHLHSNQHNP